MKTLLLSLILSTSVAQAETYVVEAHRKLSAKELKSLQNFKIEAFSTVNDPYFSRLYTVTTLTKRDELQKLSWVKSIEEAVELTRLSLEPGANPERLVKDELFPYQWCLLNQGQSYIREKDDIHNIPLLGRDNKDIGWKSIYKNIPSERPIVAVLDSGIDLKHPDLQGNLWTNEKECGKDPTLDNDQNGIPGDCVGWNFTEPKDSIEAKDPSDLDGHGTHVAGIIAAKNNGIGIVGVNSNALIMPVKIMRDTKSKAEVAASVSFAQGILYATNMGARIINLSLGWPRSLETKHLRNAIKFALDRNVILVAAAGNNNSSEPLFPCAYEGVVCAAASTLDGSFAGFSNFGAHVDAVTPGEAILSLSPILYEPDFFTVPGYDLKSGTSQSAPVLSGLISIIQAREPNLKIDEVFARIYSAPKLADAKKFILGGSATWNSLESKVTTSVVRPILKRVSRILVKGQTKDGILSVPFRNYGPVASEAQVKIESLSAGVKFADQLVSVETMGESTTKVVNFPFTVEDLEAESSIQLKITILNSEGTHTYLHQLPAVRDVSGEAGYKKLGFTFADKKVPVGYVDVEESKIQSYLSTVETYGRSSLKQFIVRRTLQEEKKLELALFTKTAESIVEAPRKIVIDNYVSLVNFIRVDLNFDGKEDYLIQTVNEDAEGKSFTFTFLNADLKPLWEKFPSGRVIFDVTVESMNDLVFTKMNHPELGMIMVPAFFTEGQLPKIDQKQDFFQRWDASKENRLYYLEPLVSDKKLRIRTLTPTTWKEKVKEELKARWSDTVLVENLLPVSADNSRKGELRVILSVGQLTKRTIVIATFDQTQARLGKGLPQIVLQTEGVDTRYAIGPKGLEASGDVFMNIYDRSRAKLVMTENSQQTPQQNYAHVSETDLLVGHVVSIADEKKMFSVIQTRDELISLSAIDGAVTKTSRPKLRYSFLSSKILSELYTPVIYNRSGDQSAALYVDSTAVTANRVYLFEEQDGKLVSSIRNSLLVPFNCKPLNPSYSDSERTHEFVFLCLEENKEWAIRTYEMH